MNSQTKFLKHALEKCTIKHIKISCEGIPDTIITNAKYKGIKNNSFVFEIGKDAPFYVIEIETIASILMVPFKAGVLTIILDNEIEIDIKF